MGFDPRGPRAARPLREPRAAAASAPAASRVTANVGALLAEIEALRRENRQLRQRLERLERQERMGRGWREGQEEREGRGERQGSRERQERVERGERAERTARAERAERAAQTERGSRPPSDHHQAGASITPQRVQRWLEALERQPGWDALRLDPPGGLQELLEVLRSQAWNPELTLEQQLDRRQSGLGAQLTAALKGAPSRGGCAIRAAFALYGPSASEWLSEEPRRVVQELARRLERLQQRGASRGAARRSADPHQLALERLGLEAGASREAIKRAYRRLAKRHHPDLGGDHDAFRALEAAYRLLLHHHSA